MLFNMPKRGSWILRTIRITALLFVPLVVGCAHGPRKAVVNASGQESDNWISLSRKQVEVARVYIEADTLPSWVEKGMTREEALEALGRDGFSLQQGTAFNASKWKVSQPWHGGYHYVTIEFHDDLVSSVDDFWNDP